MGGMQQAMLDGRNLKWQQLINRNKPWAMNGVANVPDSPLLNATVGETVPYTHHQRYGLAACDAPAWASLQKSHG